MNANDPMAIKNTTGISRAVMNEPIASYSAAAAEQGVRINDPTTNPITPGRVNQTKESQRDQGIQTGYSSADQMAVIARAFGMNIKATLAWGEGGNSIGDGTNVIGSVTRNITQEDGSVKTVYNSYGTKCNFFC